MKALRLSLPNLFRPRAAAVPLPVGPLAWSGAAPLASAVDDRSGEDRLATRSPQPDGAGSGFSVAPETQGDGTLAINHLRKAYKARRVVEDVSLLVQRGEAVGLLGPNGAGKTTVFYMITGLVRPTRARSRSTATT